MYTAQLNAQHRELKQKVQQILPLLGGISAAGKAEEAMGHVSGMIGVLVIHLAAEDRCLYPSMLSSSEPAVRDAAVRFQREMGLLAPKLQEYRAKWVTSQKVSQHPEEFCTETRGLLQLLTARIAREEAELYPLAEKAAA